MTPFQPKLRRSAQPKRAAKKQTSGDPLKLPLETTLKRRRRVAAILAKLRELLPDARCALRHKSAYELLAATILSAQCTDERVNKTTPALFAAYPDVAALAAAEQADVERLIRACGFYRNKARSLVGMARMVRDEFGGRIPAMMDELLNLPGVARKTANCVLGAWFGCNEGVVVDTHVGRLAHRLGLTSTSRNAKDAEKIERDLMELFPREAWTYISHALIEHGRAVCTARRPACSACGLADLCPTRNLLTASGQAR